MFLAKLFQRTMDSSETKKPLNFSEIIKPWQRVKVWNRITYYNPESDLISDFLPLDIQDRIDQIIKPWKTYYSIQYRREFFHNPETQQSVWDLPKPSNSKKAEYYIYDQDIPEIFQTNKPNILKINDLEDLENYKECNSNQGSSSQMGTTFEMSVRIICKKNPNLKKSSLGNLLKNLNDKSDFFEIDAIYEILNNNMDFDNFLGNLSPPWSLTETINSLEDYVHILYFEVKSSPKINDVIMFLKKLSLYCLLAKKKRKVNFWFHFYYVYNSVDTLTFKQALENYRSILTNEIKNLQNELNSSITLRCVHLLQDSGIKTLEKLLNEKDQENQELRKSLEIKNKKIEKQKQKYKHK